MIVTPQAGCSSPDPYEVDMDAVMEEAASRASPSN
jgi:hypothetical protein